MIQPKPYKYICPKCKFSKIVQPKSDVENIIEESPFCLKCKSLMDRKKLSFVDEMSGNLLK